MDAKDNFDEFNLDSDYEENADDYIVNISSESEFDEPVGKPQEENIEKCINGSEAISSSSSLENISSDEDDLETSENPSKWYTVSFQLSPESENILKSIKSEKPLITKEILLDTILQNVDPFQFIPFLYSEHEGFHNFHVFDCEDALQVLSSKNYICKSKEIKNFSFTLKISESDYKQQKNNLNQIIKSMLKKRINRDKKTLDLSNFVRDKCIKNTYYMPLWYVGNQTLLMSKLAKIIDTSTIVELDVSINDIYDFEGFNIAVALSNLQYLNLIHNKIYNIKDLLPFRGLNLKKLHLEYNPICHNYIAKNEYIRAVRLIFPTIQNLDNHKVGRNDLPSTIRNFSIDRLCTPLIDRFMLVYFAMFDSDERSSIMDLYMKDSIFSINCAKTDHIFQKRARNLLDSNNTNVYTGLRSIIGCLCWIPPTEHLPSTFSVDVIEHCEQRTVFNIYGTFLLTPTTGTKKMYDFMRTFIIVRDGNEYKITNDMLNVTVSLAEGVLYDQLTIPKSKQNLHATPLYKLSSNTRHQLANILTKLTKLNEADALSCLEKANWNFRIAVELALDIIKGRF